MICFNMLPAYLRGLLAGATFLAASGLLALALYEILTYVRGWKIALNFALFALLTAFTAYLTAAAVSPDKYPARIPVSAVAAAVVSVAAYSVCAAVYGGKRNAGGLSPMSVKETLDNLDSGVCFADAGGRIILVNAAMGKFASSLLGSYPQTLEELLSALENPPEKSGVIRTGVSGALYLFSYSSRSEILTLHPSP